MAEKDPIRGMQPMDDYNRATGIKDLAPLGLGLGLAGAAMTVSKKGAEADAVRKKARESKKAREESDAAAAENQKQHGMKKGGKVSSASSRADGIAQRGKTRGMMK